MKACGPVLTSYQDAVRRTDSVISHLNKTLNRFSFFRLSAFLAAVASIYILGNTGLLPAGLILAAVFLALFFYLVIRYIRISGELAFQKDLKRVLENEVDHLLEKGNIYPDGSTFTDPAHPYTGDLDIFGEASLFHSVNRCITVPGMRKLADWLKEASDLADIKDRQQAVKELKDHRERSEWLRAYLWPLKGQELNYITDAVRKDFKKLLAFTNIKWLKSYVSIAPYLIPFFLLLAFLTGLSWKVMFLPVLLNYLVNYRFKKKVRRLHTVAGKNAAKIQVYAIVLRWIEGENWQAAYLNNLLLQLKNGAKEQTASEQIEKLGKLLKQFDSESNFLIGIVLNLICVWDLRCAYKIRKWYEVSSDKVVNSLETIGEFEALISMSTLSYNHPEWAFPVLDKDFILDAADMGHPLIPEDNRIRNDFSFSDRKTADVITGSNMAGKSTFLRTIGVNMVLAYAGAPVCCKSLTLSPMVLITYMRIKDSLNESTSTFKAEIDRLKMILEVSAGTGNALALIDEMLRGTNSRDKYLGTKAFIKKLVEQRSSAIIATHDLQVAELEQEYPRQIRNFHFDIQTAGTEMFFDYKIKPGRCKTFNASTLLKQIGLDIEPGDNYS